MTAWNAGCIMFGIGLIAAFVDAATGLQIARALRKVVRGRPPPERQVLVSDGPVTEPLPPREAFRPRSRRIPASWGLGTFDDPVRPVYAPGPDTFYGIPRHTLLTGAPPRGLLATPEGTVRWHLALDAMRQHEEDARMDALLHRGRQALKG